MNLKLTIFLYANAGKLAFEIGVRDALKVEG